MINPKYLTIADERRRREAMERVQVDEFSDFVGLCLFVLAILFLGAL